MFCRGVPQILNFFDGLLGDHFNIIELKQNNKKYFETGGILGLLATGLRVPRNSSIRL